ncbi:MAG: rhodanese-like domain-containing protein [Candidatus Promineifilaceae bacterium]
MFLKYFYDQKLAHASYMVGCQVTGEALLIDPGRDVDIYLDAAELNEFTIVGAAETHIHADFVSGARELAERTGAKLYLSDEGDEDWKYSYLDGYDHSLLRDGDFFQIGRIRFDVWHTPGHTPEHISFLLTDTAGADEPMGIFTGDFVFVGSVGRPDLLEKAAGYADTSVTGARQIFHSLKRFRQLPDYMQIWPGHGAGSACGKGLGAVPSSTVGYEKLFNIALSYENEGQFIEMLLDGQPEPPKYFAVMKRVNKEGPPVLHSMPQPERLTAEQLPQLIADGAMVIDTRPEAAFADGHIAGTINIPDWAMPSWAGWLVDYEKPVYLIGDGGQVKTAVRDLIYIGVDDVAGYFELSALDILAASEQYLQSYETVSAEQLADLILNHEAILLDVRAEEEWRAGHIPGAHHVMLGYLPEHAAEFINDKPIVVQCDSGGRSTIGASVLQASGAVRVINMGGGIRAWSRAGLPIER